MTVLYYYRHLFRRARVAQTTLISSSVLYTFSFFGTRNTVVGFSADVRRFHVVRRGERAHPAPDCLDMAVEQQLFTDL